MSRRWRVSIVAMVSLAGCAFQTSSAEHYFGPVLFRQSHNRGCDVADLWRVGLMTEAGQQWSLAVGASERLTGRSPQSNEPDTPHWTRPLSLWPEVPAGEWSLSLLYLRGEHVAAPVVLQRRLVGIGASVGAEMQALSAGYSSRLAVQPAHDSFSVVVFDSNRPRESVCRVQPVAALYDGSLSNSLKEVQ